MLIPRIVANTLNFPWHVVKGIADVSSGPIRAITGTKYLPHNYTNPVGESDPASVYDIAKPMMDITTLIYYYTELRSATKKRLIEFATEKNLTTDLTDPENRSSDLCTIRNAIKLRNQKLRELESAEKGDIEKAAIAYRESLEALGRLVDQFELLDIEDMHVLNIYFTILSEPKDVVKIKNDFELYSKYVSPQFTFAFGGKEFQMQSVADMVERDPDVIIHSIDDDFAATSMDMEGAIKSAFSEVVYAIVVSEKSERITVVFRGSVNAKDWLMNLQLDMTNFDLPGFTSESARSDPRQTFGRVHEGFYKYLFGKTKRGENGAITSKAEEIMVTLAELKKKYEGFSIFVTGHSLGGALSTLFAFRAAAMDNFKNSTITNVSFASPYCGDLQFRKEFCRLEKANRIRHLRVSNDEDDVTLFPPVTFPIPTERYRHTGMNIRLYGGSQMFKPHFRIFYPKENSVTTEIRNAIVSNFFTGLSVGVISKHLCPEYSERLNSAEDKLHTITLEGLYSDKYITGWTENEEPEEN